MKHYKLKKLNKKEKQYLETLSMVNIIRRSFNFPEIELELKEWFIKVKPKWFKGEIIDIEINGKKNE